MLSSLAAKGLIYMTKTDDIYNGRWRYKISPLGEKLIERVLSKFPTILEDYEDYLKEKFRVRKIKDEREVDIRPGRKPKIMDGR